MAGPSFMADVDTAFTDKKKKKENKGPSFLAEVDTAFADTPTFIADVDAAFASPPETPPEPESKPLTQFIRGLTEGLSGIKSPELDPAAAAEKVKALGITDPEELERAGARIAEGARAPVNWAEKASNFGGKLTGELLGFFPALGAVSVASKIPRAAKTLSRLGKYGKPAVQSGLAGGLQETGQVIARETAGQEQSAANIAGNIGGSMLAFGAGDYFFRRVLIPAVKAAGGNVGKFVERFSQRRVEESLQTGTTPPPGETIRRSSWQAGAMQGGRKAPDHRPVDTDPAVFTSAVEDAVTASGARIDDVAAAADDIASRPETIRGAAADAEIPNIPEATREALRAQLRREGVERLTPEDVMILRRNELKNQVDPDIKKIGDMVANPFRSAKTPRDEVLPGTAIKIETITDGDDAARVVSEFAKVLREPRPTTISEVNAKLSNYNIQNFGDMNIPKVLEEAGLRVRVMEAAGRETWNDLARLVSEGAGPERFAKTIRNGIMMLEKVRDARSAAGLLLRTMQPDARLGPAAARRMRKTEQALLKKIEERLTRGGKIDERFKEALLALDGDDPAQLIAFLDEFYSPGVWERISAFRYANMLSSPKTMMINITGNLAQGMRASVQRPVAAGLDAMITPLGRSLGKDLKRDRFFRESTSLAALADSMPQAARAVIRKLQTGESTFGQYRYDLPILTNRRRIFSDPYQSPLLRKNLERVEGALQLPAKISIEALDEIQKILGYNVNMRALAIRSALRENPNLAGKELNEQVIRILGARTDPERIAFMRSLGDDAAADLAERANAIEQQAVKETLKNIFQSPDSRTAKFFMSLRDDPNKLGGVGTKILQVEFPFLNTPIQLGERGFELFAPYQMFRIGLKATGRGGFKKYAGKGEFVDDLAALTIGLPIAFMTYDLVKRGVITGNRMFFDDAQRKIELQNQKPFSINAGGHSIEYGRIDPPAFAIGLTANLTEAYMNEKLLVSPWEFIGGVFTAVTSTFKDKLYLKAFSDMVEVFSSTNDEDRWARVMSRKVSGYASQMVPAGALSSSIRRMDQPARLRADDPVEAMSRRYDVGDQSNLYGYYSILGERITDLLDPTNFTYQALNLLSPFRISEHRSPAVIDELIRLKVSAYTAPLHKKANGITLSPQEFDSLNQGLSELAVPALNALIERDLTPEGVAAIAKALPRGKRDIQGIQASITARKYLYSYDMLPDNRESVRGYRPGEFKEKMSKEWVISEILRGARMQAREGVFNSQVLPRLEAAGITPQNIADIRSGRASEEDFGLGDF